MNRIFALMSNSFKGNILHLCGQNTGNVLVGTIATRHDRDFIQEAKELASSYGEEVRFLYECWPTTGAQATDPSGRDLYRYLTHVANTYNLWLRDNNGALVQTNWGRPFPWWDMRSNAPLVQTGPFIGKRPFQILSELVNVWWVMVNQLAYEGFQFDIPLYLGDVWLGSQAQRMPVGWEYNYAQGVTAALSHIRSQARVMCATDTVLFPDPEDTDGGVLEHFQHRFPVLDDLFGKGRRSLRLSSTAYRHRINDLGVMVKLHPSTTFDQLRTRVASALMYDAHISWETPRATQVDTIGAQLEAIEELQDYARIKVLSAAQFSQAPATPERLEADVNVVKDNIERKVSLSLPSGEVRGL